MRVLRAVVLGMALGLVTGGATAAAAPAAGSCDKAAAKAQFAIGQAHFKAGRYLAAVKALKKSYKLCPMPVLLYRVGETLQAAGLDEYAARAYCRFLDEAVVTHPKRALAKAALQTLKQQCKQKTPAPPTAPPKDKLACKAGLCHAPLEEASGQRDLWLTARVAAGLGPRVQVYLYYRPRGQAAYHKVLMRADRRGVYRAAVPAARLTGSSLQYYLEAVGLTGTRVAGAGSKGLPNIVALKAAPRRDLVPKPKPFPVPHYAKKLYGFIGGTALTVASFVVAGILTYNARQKAQEMANAGVVSPRQIYDPTLQKIEQQGKAMEAAAIACYVVGSLALGTTAWLAYELWIRKYKERAAPAPGIRVGHRVTLAPSIHRGGLGLSGGFTF